MKGFTRVELIFAILSIVLCIGAIGLVGGIIYTAVHFIIKFW